MTRSTRSAKSSKNSIASKAICGRKYRSTSSASWKSVRIAGFRHRRGLPDRGQRTHTNARTRKGPRARRSRGDARRLRQQRHSKVEFEMEFDRWLSQRKKAQRRRKSGSCRAAWLTFRRRSTTPSSRLRIWKATLFAGRAPARSVSRGRAKGTPFAAQQAAVTAANRAREVGMRSLEVNVKGPGSGRDSAIRALQTAGLEIRAIRDVTPIPHNGCRPPKRRRV